ncbi:xin actin-binding repeat-containing protein 1-like [Eleginops maclovinus]|uniref:xin actin-binding repeat-containing protein 1-like n=1 Tax=Eleginops maclovinus TaxID=56733 RepID=UPI00308059A8
MIYRNSGKACSGKSQTVQQQCVVVSVPPSDTKLSPSISVTCEGQPSVTTQNSTPNPVANGNSRSSSSVCEAPPPLPQKTSEKPQEQKPALPPKPQWIKSVVVKDENILAAPNALCTITDNTKSVEIFPKPNKSFPKPSPEKLSGTVTHGKTSKEALHEHQNCIEAFHHSNPTQESLPTHSKVQEIKKKKKRLTGSNSEGLVMMLNSTEMEMDRNVIQKINAAEEIQMCMKNYAEEGKHEMNMSLQSALHNFERKHCETQEKRAPLFPKRVKVINDSDSEHKQTNKSTAEQHQSPPKNECKIDDAQQTSETKTCHVQQNEKTPKLEDKVVLREKKVRETDDQRRQRLSVHKEEIMKGNEKAACEIFENLRKREELKGILSQVQEMEGETLHETVPAWMVTTGGNARQSKTGERKVEVETQDDDLESISSVETAFEDLEKASKEIMHLKEETLAKLLDIEETIKKALYSVSNLKSEADIAGLSGLFDESLKTEQSFQPANNIRKISIGSSKVKSSHIQEASVGNMQTVSDSSSSKQEVRRQVRNKPLIRQSSSQSSPSFISIHSAARKPVEQPKSPMSTFKPITKGDSESCHESAVPLKNDHSPAQRKVSVLEVKTVPEQPVGIVGTKTVSETYEETDGFGNVFVSSVTSTFVTKQSESKPSALFEVVGNPAKYEVISSPLIRRSARPFEEKVLSTANNEGTVFVTFSQPKEKH